jgi:hypothetical protein
MPVHFYGREYRFYGGGQIILVAVMEWHSEENTFLTGWCRK